MHIQQICQSAKQASRGLALLPAQQKDRALENLADWIISHIDLITEANQKGRGRRP